MSESEDLLSVIARVRRAMPLNKDVMRICDEAEKIKIALVAERAANKPAPARQSAKLTKRIVKRAERRK